MKDLYGKTFATLAFMFADAVCIGIKCGVPREGPEGEEVYIILNPLGLDVLEEGDSLLFIAEDDDTYSPYNADGSLADFSCFTGHCPDFEPPPVPPTKTLLIGWRRDIQDMVMELDKWVEPGSQLTMLQASRDEEECRAELEENYYV